MGILLPPGLTAARLQNTARLGLMRSRRVLSGWGMASLAAASTSHSTWALEGDFDLVRLVFENDTASPYTIDFASVAAVSTENFAGGLIPLQADGVTKATLVPATFNNAGAAGFPPSPTGSTRGVTVPAIGSASTAFAVSDWLRVPSVAPLAGGSLRLLAVRSYSAGAVRALKLDSVMADLNPTLAQGRIVSAYHQASNNRVDYLFALTPSGILGYSGATAVQYYTRARGATVYAVGDSLTMGTTSSGGANGYGHQACVAISAPGSLPVSFVNGGWSGQTAAGFYARGRLELDLFRPEIAIIETSSPNGGPTTQAAFDLMFSQALDLAHYAITLGIVPILKTAVPFVYGTAADNLRKAINARVRALGASGGVLVLDADVAVTDGATPARSLPQYLGSDSEHLNDAGHAAIAQQLVPVLSRALGR